MILPNKLCIKLVIFEEWVEMNRHLFRDIFEAWLRHS